MCNPQFKNRYISCQVLVKIGVVGPREEYFNSASFQVLTSSVHPMRSLLADTSQSQDITHTKPLFSHQGIHTPANHCERLIVRPLAADTATRIDFYFAEFVHLYPHDRIDIQPMHR